jgi:hypothetical protein
MTSQAPIESVQLHNRVGHSIRYAICCKNLPKPARSQQADLVHPLSAYGRAWYLTYKAVGGTVTINHLCG